MKSVLIISNNSGGLYIFRKDLITALIQRGYCVKAVTPLTSRVSEFHKMGVELIDSRISRRSKNPLNELRLFKEYLTVIKKEKPDLLITYTIKPNIYGGLVARLRKTSYVANITGIGTAFQHEGFLLKFICKMYKFALKKAKTVFFENHSNAELFIQQKIIPNKKAVVLNGAGVDTDYFSLIDYPKSDLPINFLFIGRIMKEKGIQELFQAMEKLIADGFSCKLTIAGSMEEDFDKDVELFQRAGWLNYVGYSNDVREHIRKAHCSVLPSWHEGMSNTNLECASCGRPLITSNIAGCKEAVVDGVSGMICKVRDPDDLYYTMKRFIELPLQSKREMGIKGRNHMIQHFDKRQVVEETLKHL